MSRKRFTNILRYFFLLINPRFINFPERNISEIYIFFLEIYQFSGKLKRLNKVIWLCFLKNFYHVRCIIIMGRKCCIANCNGNYDSLINVRVFRLQEVVVQRCSVKKMFLEVLQNLRENTCARVSFE